MTHIPNSSNPFLLEATGIVKAYGHVQALSGVNIGVRQGEVLALVGDNGAGKSTLVKILSGVQRPDSGQLMVAGRQVEITSPADARDAGIATVFQDLSLINSRDVAANLFLGREFTRGPFGWFVDAKKGRLEAEILLKRLGARIPSVRANVEMLSGGQRQAIAIARAVAEGGNIVIMDEPTAALGVIQSRQVLDLARDLALAGLGVIMITHNLSHAFEIATRVQVMYRGTTAGIRNVSDTSADEIVKMITFGAQEASPV